MASRKDAKEQARKEREAAEQSAAAAAARKRRLGLLGGASLLALVVVVALIAVSGGDGDDAPSPDETDGLIATIDSIPQEGNALGDPDAPVTMVEFVDMQCPFCADASRDVITPLIEDYVASGDLRIELEILDFIGPDSEALARAAYAASQEDKLWQFAELAFARQGAENSGYVDAEFIETAGADAGVDDPASLEQTGATPEVQDLVAAADARANAVGVSSTPSFLLGPTDGQLDRLEPSALEPAEFRSAIDQLLNG